MLYEEILEVLKDGHAWKLDGVYKVGDVTVSYNDGFVFEYKALHVTSNCIHFITDLVEKYNKV